MSWFNNIPTPPFKYDFMMVCQKYRCIQGPTTRLWSPFNNYYVEKAKEKGKTTWGKSSLKKGHEMQTKNSELLLMLLQTKCCFVEEYSSWEEDKSAHLDQGQLQDHVEQLRSNDVKAILKDIETCNQLQDDDMT